MPAKFCITYTTTDGEKAYLNCLLMWGISRPNEAFLFDSESDAKRFMSGWLFCFKMGSEAVKYIHVEPATVLHTEEKMRRTIKNPLNPWDQVYKARNKMKAKVLKMYYSGSDVSFPAKYKAAEKRLHILTRKYVNCQGK